MCPSYKESKKTTVQRQGPTLGICLREELNLSWMFAMVKRKLMACIYTIIQAKDRPYGSIYLLILFNEFNYPLTMFATTLSCNKVGSCLYRVIFFAPWSLLALKFNLKHLQKQCKLKLNTRLIFDCHTLKGKILSRLFPQTTWEKKDSCLETILSYRSNDP